MDQYYMIHYSKRIYLAVCLQPPTKKMFFFRILSKLTLCWTVHMEEQRHG